MNKQFLLDQAFLQKLAEFRERTIYAKIILLSLDETPLEKIEGKVTTGSINIDGASAVRRSCSLTMIAKDTNISNFQWGLNTKFKLEIGMDNPYLEDYPDPILWFPEGIYVITNLNISQNVNNFNISISGKDKMCLLNGSVGGSLPATIDFGTISILEKGVERLEQVLIKDIIREAVQNYGNELPQNIIINDLDEMGLELLEYRGEDPLYLFKTVGSNIYSNMTLDGEMLCYIKDGDANPVPLSSDQIIYDNLIELSPSKPSTIVTLSKDSTNQYTIAKFDNTTNSAIGYQLTDLVYAGSLIARPGEALTSVLDKIKNMLGFYEYFYNLDGKFVFQRKKDYAHIPWNPLSKQDNEIYVDSTLSATKFSFTNSTLITSFQNTPNLLNLKNEFSVWGTRKGMSGKDIPICMRYGICQKPEKYYSPYQKKAYLATGPGGWREVLYQMAKDYRKHYHDDDFTIDIAHFNPWYISGKTGYEQFYTEMLGYWRDIYNPEAGTDENFDADGWTKNLQTPEKLNFWIDFLDSGLDQFSISTIGPRPKTINDTKINAIYYKEVPNVIFITPEETIENQQGYSYIQLSDSLKSLFFKTPQRKSAQEGIEELLYKHSYCIESVTLNTIPVYHLQPNSLISVRDDASGINGYYAVNKITIPLTYNGVMTINAVKTPDKII